MRAVLIVVVLGLVSWVPQEQEPAPTGDPVARPIDTIEKVSVHVSRFADWAR